MLDHLPREMAFNGVLIPTVALLFMLAGVLTWGLDRVLARIGLYQYVWHINLFRLSVFVCVYVGMGLLVHSS